PSAPAPLPTSPLSLHDALPISARTDVPGPSRPKELRELLAGVRREGVARESGEVTEELASVAAVVRDHAGWPAAAVALTFVEQAADGPRRALCEAAVRRAADELTRRLVGRLSGMTDSIVGNPLDPP